MIPRFCFCGLLIVGCASSGASRPDVRDASEATAPPSFPSYHPRPTKVAAAVRATASAAHPPQVEASSARSGGGKLSPAAPETSSANASLRVGDAVANCDVHQVDWKSFHYGPGLDAKAGVMSTRDDNFEQNYTYVSVDYSDLDQDGRPEAYVWWEHDYTCLTTFSCNQASSYPLFVLGVDRDCKLQELGETEVRGEHAARFDGRRYLVGQENADGGIDFTPWGIVGGKFQQLPRPTGTKGP